MHTCSTCQIQISEIPEAGSEWRRASQTASAQFSAPGRVGCNENRARQLTQTPHILDAPKATCLLSKMMSLFGREQERAIVLAHSSKIRSHRFAPALLLCCVIALGSAVASAQSTGSPADSGSGGGSPMQSGAGNAPMNGSPSGGSGNGSDWRNQHGNFNNNWKGGGWRGRGFGKGYFPQQVSGSFFTRPYPYHLDYYRMRWGGSYAPYYGNLYGPSNSFYPSQYNGDFGPNYFFGQNNPGSSDLNSGPPSTMGDPSSSGGYWTWCWVPYSGSPVHGAGPPTFESVGPTYERGPIYGGPFPVFVPSSGDAAPINASANGPTNKPGSTIISQSMGINTIAPAVPPAH
jgi:hypothetical protein